MLPHTCMMVLVKIDLSGVIALHVFHHIKTTVIWTDRHLWAVSNNFKWPFSKLWNPNLWPGIMQSSRQPTDKSRGPLNRTATHLPRLTVHVIRHSSQLFIRVRIYDFNMTISGIDNEQDPMTSVDDRNVELVAIKCTLAMVIVDTKLRLTRGMVIGTST